MLRPDNYPNFQGDAMRMQLPALTDTVHLETVTEGSLLPPQPSDFISPPVSGREVMGISVHKLVVKMLAVRYRIYCHRGTIA